jgi:signal transduction histidine kinase/CheY-like chemotaxis protein
MKKPFKIASFFPGEVEETQAVDLRISSDWTVVVLILAAILTLLAALAAYDTPRSAALQNLSLVLFCLAGLSLFIYARRPLLGIMQILASLVACILLSNYWLHLPGLLLLLAVPVVLAAVVTSLRTALAFAMGESLALVICLAVGWLLPGESLAFGGSVALIWLAFFAMLAIYLPVYQAVNWYRTNYNLAQIELESLRGEREDRVQLIEDLDNANRQMAALYDKTSVLRQIAEDSEKSKAIFVAKVSHEFRTPLSMIIGLSSLMTGDQNLYRNPLPPELVEDMTVIHRNCSHLAKLVDDVLDLSRAEAGQLTIYREWTDISHEIEEAVSEIYPLLEKKKLELVLEMSDALPRVYCDRARIRQVVLNLMGNAARYTQHGSIRVSISADERQMLFEIADTGQGIPPADLDRIFEPFARGQNRPAGDTGGSGLGLSICRQFVDLHGGQIWVNSQPGNGSVFAFKIPIYPQEAPRSSPARWISHEKIWETRKPRLTIDSTPTRERVMLYDSSGEFLPLMHHYADKIDFVHVDNLEDAIQQCKHNPVAVVLVNGRTLELTLQVVEQIRIRLFDTAVIGCIYPAYQEHLRESGVVSYLIKPVVVDELRQVLDEAPGRKQRILLVDDDSDLLKLLERMLLSLDEGCEIMKASSGEEALKMMAAQKPDLVFLDIVLGGMSGWDVLAARGSSPDLSDVPVVILSGQDPQHEQFTTPVMLSAFGNGLPVDKLLQSALDFSAVMFSHEG